MDLVSFWLVILSLLLFIFYAFVIAFYKRGWEQCPEFEPSSDFIPAQKVSVIIPARNEQEHIVNCLTSLQNQSYPSSLFEILVVDDHSEDKTAELVNGLSLSNVRLIQLQEYFEEKINSYKKKAIEVAIKESNGDWIITTDADCILPKDWILNMMAYQKFGEFQLIAGPVKINAHEIMLEIFQALDFLTLQGITGAAVYRNFHMMCNGANLAYSKIAFHEVNGFKNIDTVASGDDMFLMHKIAVKYPAKTGYLKSRNAIVATAPMKNWNAFLQQRIRWSSKADKYEDKIVFWILLLVYLFNFFLLALFIGSIFNPDTLLVAIILLLCKTVIEFPFVRSVSKFFSQQKFMFFFPFLQPLHVLYVVITGFLGKFGSYRWKGRKVK